ncbi:MAG TPA: ATP-dependent zinc protease, partial [Halomonas sp.]|nr:ATP-dependent zinc protease [Halomonas sp.]
MIKTGLGVWGVSVLASTLLLGATAQAEDAQTQDNVFGWVENAYIEPWGIAVKAKLDSG